MSEVWHVTRPFERPPQYLLQSAAHPCPVLLERVEAVVRWQCILEFGLRVFAWASVRLVFFTSLCSLRITLPRCLQYPLCLVVARCYPERRQILPKVCGSHEICICNTYQVL